MTGIKQHAARLAMSAIVVVWGTGQPAAYTQVGAGPLANFKDQETWERVDPATRQPERGLGLVLSGAGGETRLAFVARGRASSGGPATLAVQIYRSVRGNPTAVPAVIVKFVIDPASPQRRTIDLSARAVAYPPGPAVPPESVTAPLSSADCARLAGAREIDVQLLDVTASLRADQIRALQAFARAVGIVTGP